MSLDIAGLRWYVIHCKPRQDARALENLQRQGFHCYRPMRSVERCHTGHRRTTLEPLFPGYLFVRLSCLNDKWYAIGSTRGVNQIVRFNAYPFPVRDEIIYGIQTRLAAIVESEPYLTRGDRVRITDGAFSHLEAIFISDDGGQRVLLLLSVLQQEQTLSFPARSIEKVS